MRLANTLVKSTIAAGMGSPELRCLTLAMSGLLFATGIAAAFLI